MTWFWRTVAVSERTGFKRSSRSIRARSRALPSVGPDIGLECTCPDENAVSLARRESPAEFLEVSLQLVDPLMDTGGLRWLLPP